MIESKKQTPAALALLGALASQVAAELLLEFDRPPRHEIMSQSYVEAAARKRSLRRIRNVRNHARERVSNMASDLWYPTTEQLRQLYADLVLAEWPREARTVERFIQRVISERPKTEEIANP